MEQSGIGEVKESATTEQQTRDDFEPCGATAEATVNESSSDHKWSAFVTDEDHADYVDEQSVIYDVSNINYISIFPAKRTNLCRGSELAIREGTKRAVFTRGSLSQSPGSAEVKTHIRQQLLWRYVWIIHYNHLVLYEKPVLMVFFF